MAGYSWKIAQNAPTATATRDGKTVYDVPIIVEMTSAADGPATVISYLRSEGFHIGTPYAFGNDYDPFALCNKINPNREPRSAKKWNVSTTFSPMDEDDQQQTPDGAYSEDPEQWRWKISSSYATWQEPCWSAINITAFPHWQQTSPPTDPYTRPAGTPGPIVNSAGIPLDPTLMRDLFDRVFQITAYSLEYPPELSDAYMGAINDDAIRYHDHLVSAYNITQITTHYYPRTWKCTNAAPSHRLKTIGGNRVAYWEWNWEFRYRRQGWTEKVLDRGMSARAADGGPDGIGGQMGTIPDGAAPSMPVLDGKGRRVPEMVLFNGAGEPMPAGAAEEDDGYYFEWQKDDVLPFASIPFPFFQT